VLRLLPTSLDEPGATVLAVGAHADDIEIGAGGTLLRWRRDHPGVRLVWLVVSAEGARADEARAAAWSFGADDVTVADLPDQRLPSVAADVRALVRAALDGLERCDVVLGPWRSDRHQDHRTVAEVLWQVARRVPLWAYEIPKWEDDLGRPGLFVDLDEDLVERKVELLATTFPSQAGRSWFDPVLFRGLMRLRGVHAGTTWAEGFHVEKLVV
jgi:LmbE family N-acetylglucosaminyl deacetylase